MANDQSTIDEKLLQILTCPEPDCRGSLLLDEGYLACGECRRRYPIENGIPILLRERAILPDGS